MRHKTQSQAPPKYYPTGSRARADVRGLKFTLNVDDICTHDIQLPDGPVLWWVNPPLSDASNSIFQKRAAKASSGIEYRKLADLYRSIVSKIRDHDSFVMVFKDSPKLDGFLAKLQVGDTNLSEMVSVMGNYRDKTVRIIMHNVPVIHDGPIEYTDDSAKNYASLFVGRGASGWDMIKIEGLEMIVDPCAGASPMLDVALKSDCCYYGVEINGMQAFRRMLTLRREGTILEEPAYTNTAPSGVVVGAPEEPPRIGDRVRDPERCYAPGHGMLDSKRRLQSKKEIVIMDEAADVDPDLMKKLGEVEISEAIEEADTPIGKTHYPEGEDSPGHPEETDVDNDNDEVQATE